MERLRQERIRLGLTQSALAFLAGLAQSDISKFERGYAKPYPAQAERLAAVLGVDSGELANEVVADVGARP